LLGRSGGDEAGDHRNDRQAGKRAYRDGHVSFSRFTRSFFELFAFLYGAGNRLRPRAALWSLRGARRQRNLDPRGEIAQ
jgi:hypothetical protein